MGNCPPGATAAAGTNAANANDDPWYSFIIARPRSAASTMVRVEVVALPRDLVVPLVTTSRSSSLLSSSSSSSLRVSSLDPL